jgi:hypothetical protein
MSKQKKQRKKRDLEKYPALNPRLNAKTRAEVLDMDYLKKLNEEELKFLDQFMAEYVSGSFKKNAVGTYSDDNFHKTPEERRQCYTRNNIRNRCGLTISNATGQTYRSSDIDEFIDNLNNAEMNLHTSDFNVLSNLIYDEYLGNSDNLESEILEEMRQDYEACINPTSNSDRKLAASNYGKYLMLVFNNADLKKKG